MSDPSESGRRSDEAPPTRPPSVREVAGPPKPASERGQTPRPTPVREAIGREAAEVPAEVPVPERDFEDREGRTWRVTLLGRTRTGTGSDAGTPLALLGFRPEPAREGLEAREVLAVVTELDALADDELRSLLERAGAPGFEPSPLFPGTRRGRRQESGG